MKKENKVKKLVLKKETLRDLTAQNAGAVMGGMKKTLNCTLAPTACRFFTCRCHAHTKKCGID